MKTTNCANSIFAMLSTAEEEFANEEVNYLHHFKCDPLALVLYWTDEDVLLPNNADPVYMTDVVSCLMTDRITHNEAYIAPEKYITWAKEIREYYNNKYSYSLLVGDNLSDTQKTIAELVSNTSNTIRRELIPLLVSLPRMYNEDIKIEKAMEEFTSIDERTYDVASKGHYQYNNSMPSLGSVEHNLTFHSISRRKTFRTSSARHDFWFRNEDNNLVRYQLPSHTQEAYLLEKLVQAYDGKIKVYGTTVIKKLFNHNFYHYIIIGRIDIV